MGLKGFLVRYAALSLVVTGVVVILLTARRTGWRKVVFQLGLFLGSALPLPLLWILRNADSGAQYLLGPRLARPGNLTEVFPPFARSIVNIFDPVGANVLVVAAVFVSVLSMVGLAAWIQVRRRSVPVLRALDGRPSVLPLATIAVVYALFIMAAGKFSGASIDARTVMPLYLPLIIMGGVLVGKGLEAHVPTDTARRASSLDLLSKVSWVATFALAALLMVSFVQMASVKGSTTTVYASRSYTKSRLVSAVRGLRPGVVLTTNHPWRLYYATGREPILPSPGPLQPAASLVPITVDQLGDRSCSQPTYYVWYRSSGDSPTNPPSFTRDVRLVALDSYEDGVLYAVHATDGECSEHS